ncbi:response regulator [Calothrix sp. NIES-3974]|uniref:response regulator n=1 Tax=Calothrix sp. NIES-3974 TaxID=2005462 RepID=UPI000B5E2055|nr:response regulator [Calothrix sp. NIES-3974]BAZ04888.1 response regulator receiver protein [Calothrix sp. NIES-3974]
MSTTPLGSYKILQKIHPLSLLAQLTGRRATGRLRVSTGSIYWSLYLQEGKLVYASYSDQLFDWLDGHLERLERRVEGLNQSIRAQMRVIFEAKHDDFASTQADYQAICWLVNRNYISSGQAGELIEEMAKEVLVSFLRLKEGNYDFSRETSLDEMPKFCHLDMRVLVEYCQQQLRSQYYQTTEQGGNRRESSMVQVFERDSNPTTAQQESMHLLEKSHEASLGDEGNGGEVAGEKVVSKKHYVIACIDDSPTVLNSIQHFLDESVFAVVKINDPVKALMQILRSKPNLILLDVEMPNLDGYELCSLLRRHSMFKDTPIVMVTGRTGFIDRAKAKMVRASGYLTKPFTQADLLKIVYKHLN